MKMLKKLFIYVTIVCLFPSCAELVALECTSDVAGSLRGNRNIYPDRAICDSLAREGKVCRGQTYRNVRKAWGAPDQKSMLPLNVDYKVLHVWMYTDRNYAVEFIGGRVVGKRQIYQPGMYFDAKKGTYVNP